MIINEAIDFPMDFTPPAIVHTISSQSAAYQKEEMRKLETVVACLILEAGGEGKVGMEAVNEVIHERAKKQNKSLYEIVTAPKQFSVFKNGITTAVERAKKHSKWVEATRILKDPLTNHTRGADHYHIPSVRPIWSKELLKRLYKTIRIGNHIFYYPTKVKPSF